MNDLAVLVKEWQRARKALCKARLGWAGSGKARRGKAGQGKARRGVARLGVVRLGQAWLGWARQGKARQGANDEETTTMAHASEIRRAALEEVLFDQLECSLPQEEIERLRDAIIRALAGTPAPDPWRPIETAPKDGTHILVAYPLFDKGNLTDKPDEYSIMIVHWKGHGWDTGFWCLHETPKGWQPLPPAPG